MPGHSFKLPDSIVPVLAGGGTRLPAHIGVLKALNDIELNFHQLVGVSGGSIIAALYACGKSLDEILQLAIDVDFRRFRGFSLYQLIRYGGLSSGRSFEAWLLEQIKDVTFADIDYELHIVATDVNSSKPVIFNRKETPNTRVVDAVRCSMGIPLIFSFRQQDDRVLVDGSILSEGVLRQDWSGVGHPVCLFRIRSNGTQRYHFNGRPSLPKFLSMIIRTFMISMSQEYIHDAWWNSTLIIDSGNLSPLEFSLTIEAKYTLYELGYQSTMEFLPIKLSRNPESIMTI